MANKTGNDEDTAERSEVERFDSLLKHLQNLASAYHHHKENMAHAGLLVQIALFGWIMSTEKPPWISDLKNLVGNCLAAIILSLLIMFLWSILHIFIRRQLRYRRWAAIHTAAISRVLLRWARQRPTSKDLKPENRKSERDYRDVLLSLMDHFVPWLSAEVRPDIGHDEYPSSLVQAQEKQSTGAFLFEWLLAIGSVIMLVLIIIRTVLWLIH